MKIFLKIAALLFFIGSYSQTTVKGKVTDEAGLPIPGANVIIEGTSTGTATDFDGMYTLETERSFHLHLRFLILVLKRKRFR